jgi:hypothetical protein
MAYGAEIDGGIFVLLLCYRLYAIRHMLFSSDG